jgi:hypothetical protein
MICSAFRSFGLAPSRRRFGWPAAEQRSERHHLEFVYKTSPTNVIRLKPASLNEIRDSRTRDATKPRSGRH